MWRSDIHEAQAIASDGVAQSQPAPLVGCKEQRSCLSFLFFYGGVKRYHSPPSGHPAHGSASNSERGGFRWESIPLQKLIKSISLHRASRHRARRAHAYSSLPCVAKTWCASHRGRSMRHAPRSPPAKRSTNSEVSQTAIASLAFSMLEVCASTFDTSKRLLHGIALGALTVPRLRRCLIRGLIALRASSAALRLLSPRMHRELAVNARITPVLASYMIAKRRIRALPPSERAAAWDMQHEWGSERARRIVEDFGGFYTKLGQITGTAAHLMPRQWVRALGETMDNNPPVPFSTIRGIVERGLGGRLEDLFERFDREPVATASVAQVHRARVSGIEVAVKVGLGRKRVIISDVRTMREQAERMKRLGLDAGLDMPSILRAYEDIVPEEFDFDVELAKIERFNATLERARLGRLVSIPEPVRELCCPTVLTLKWMDGVKFSDVLKNSDQHSAPALPPAFAAKFGSWPHLFETLFEVWGAMIFMQKEFHCDPHPANLLALSDGRVGILDFGQTKRIDDRLATACAQACIAMSAGDIASLARAIENLGEFDLINASPSTWALVSYTFFDTRWTPLSNVNVYDLDRSFLAKGGFRKNSAEVPS